MHTTITVNGLHGAHFLSALGEQLASHRSQLAPALVPALAPLLDGRVTSLEVDTAIAEHLADAIEPILAGADDPHDPPLLFSPNVGDTIVIVRDALFEYQPPARRGARIWRFTPRGTKGRVLAHEPEADRVQIEASREVAFVRPQSMTGVRFWSHAPR
jgi:hypothetical protein